MELNLPDLSISNGSAINLSTRRDPSTVPLLSDEAPFSVHSEMLWPNAWQAHHVDCAAKKTSAEVHRSQKPSAALSDPAEVLFLCQHHPVYQSSLQQQF